MHTLAWAAIAGWLAPIPLAMLAGIILRLSPRLRAKLFDRDG